MSENERQSQTNVVINDKLQGTEVTYLRCGVFVRTGLVLSPPVKALLKSVNIWQSYWQTSALRRALSSYFSSAVASHTKCTSQPPSYL